MADQRPQNPYDPGGWVGRVEIVRYATVFLPLTTWTRIIVSDADRIWFVVSASGFENNVRIWPSVISPAAGIASGAGLAHILVHNASYPSLVQDEWFGFANTAAATLHIVAGRAIA